MDEKVKEEPRCPYCKGSNVVKDAWAEWDYEKQEFVIMAIYDEEYCTDCEGSIRMEWHSITPPEKS